MLIDRIAADMKDAMRAKDAARLFHVAPAQVGD